MKIAIIGYGSIGRRHAANAALLADVLVYDVDAALLSSLETPGIKPVQNLEALLAEKPDGVVIATPHKTHIEYAAKAVEAGAHVLIEKPISHSMEGVQTFISLAAKKNRKAFVVCNMRFHPGIRLLRENLARLGKIYFARAHFGNFLPNMRPGADYRAIYSASREQGGGIVLDAIHEIDYLTWLLGKVTHVSGEGKKLSNLEIDVEDYASIVMQHAGGAYSEIHFDYLQQYKRRGCEIVGENGTLIWTSEGKTPELCTVRLYDKAAGRWQVLYDAKADPQKPYIELIQAFAGEIRGAKSPILLEAAAAAQELETALAIYRAMESGAKTPVKSDGA